MRGFASSGLGRVRPSSSSTAGPRVSTSAFPNWDGTAQKRALKVAGDELTYTVTAPSAGGPPNDVVWKRMK